MQYIFKEEELEIKLSWKERFMIFLKGCILMNRFDSYKHSTVLMKLASDAVKQYGDAKEHGEIEY